MVSRGFDVNAFMEVFIYVVELNGWERGGFVNVIEDMLRRVKG